MKVSHAIAPARLIDVEQLLCLGRCFGPACYIRFQSSQPAVRVVADQRSQEESSGCDCEEHIQRLHELAFNNPRYAVPLSITPAAHAVLQPTAALTQAEEEKWTLEEIYLTTKADPVWREAIQPHTKAHLKYIDDPDKFNTKSYNRGFLRFIGVTKNIDE
jgi:hypothetical protein